MTSQPTPDQVADAATVIGKAALFDPRMQAADPAMAVAWAEIFAQHNVDLDDLLAAVTAHYANSNDRVMPADVLRLARTAKRDRIDRAIGSDTAPPAPALTPATTEARRKAIKAAVAKIGAEHDPDRGRELPHAPVQPKAESQATIAAKVARARAAAPPAPLPPDRPDADVKCSTVNPADEAADCLLAAGHLGPHHYGTAKATR